MSNLFFSLLKYFKIGGLRVVGCVLLATYAHVSDNEQVLSQQKKALSMCAISLPALVINIPTNIFVFLSSLTFFFFITHIFLVSSLGGIQVLTSAGWGGLNH